MELYRSEPDQSPPPIKYGQMSRLSFKKKMRERE